MKLPDPLPPSLRLKPAPGKWMWHVAGSAVFVAIGVWMITDQASMGWPVAGFFGLCLTAGIVQMSGFGSYLEMGPGGFAFATFFRRSAFRWADVYDFGVWEMHMNKMVVFSHTPSEGRTLAQINWALSGGSQGIPDTFGLSAEALADLLKTYQRRYLKPVDDPDRLR